MSLSNAWRVLVVYIGCAQGFMSGLTKKWISSRQHASRYGPVAGALSLNQWSPARGASLVIVQTATTVRSDSPPN